jgi:hypothetical protein
MFPCFQSGECQGSEDSHSYDKCVRTEDVGSSGPFIGHETILQALECGRYLKMLVVVQMLVLQILNVGFANAKVHQLKRLREGAAFFTNLIFAGL